MAHGQPFSIVFDRAVHEHLRAIQRKHHPLIRETLGDQLRFEPEVETRNRKPLRPTVALRAGWKLRFGPDNRFRVLYAVDRDRREVQVLAIGVKERGRLIVGGEEIEL